MEVVTLAFACWPLAAICFAAGIAARLPLNPWYRLAILVAAITISTLIAGAITGFWMAALWGMLAACGFGFILIDLAASAQANLRHPRAIRWVIGALLLLAAVMALGSGDTDRIDEIGGQLILLAIVIYGIATMFRGPRRSRR